MKSIKTIVTLMIFSLSLNLFAEKPVSISETSLKFVESLDRKGAVFHRSGAKGETTVEKNNKKVPLTESSYYLIENNQEMTSLLEQNYMKEKSLAKGSYFVKKLDDLRSVVVEKQKAPHPDDLLMGNGGFSEEDYKTMAKFYLPEDLGIADSLEVSRVDIEKTQCVAECDFLMGEEIASVYVRFRRVFNGRVVDPAVSKVTVKLDPNGDLRRLSITWPKITVDPDFSTNSHKLVSNSDVLDHVVNELRNSEASVVAGIDEIEIEKFAIKGVANFWLLQKQGEKEVLLPAISFIVESTLKGDGEKVYRFVNIPLI